MKVYVHVREAIIPLECGDGSQRIKWLGNAAMVHYDAETLGKKYGAVRSIRKEGGLMCDSNGIINQLLEDQQHVFAELPEKM